jgi:AcrR family transcriptional regulator
VTSTDQLAVAPTRTDRRRVQTRRKLTAAARELIAESGVANLRVGEITERADVGRGSFYNHFESKDDVVAAVVRDSLEELATSVVAAVVDSADDAAAGASAADRRFLRLAYDDPAFARLLVQLGTADTLFMDAVRPYARDALERGIASGRFQVSNLDVVLTMLAASAIALIRSMLEGGAPPDADQYHAESVLRMLGVPPDEALEISRRPL